MMGKLGLAVVGVVSIILSSTGQASAADPWYRGILACKRCRPSEGKIACPICKVAGKLADPCRKCSGTGRRPCPKCSTAPVAVNGVLAPGRLFCTNCQGKGSILKTFSRTDTVTRTCRYCSGSGNNICLVCNGKGDLRCKKEGRIYDCPLCLGDGRVGCPDCPKRVGRYFVFFIDRNLVGARVAVYEWRRAIWERNVEEIIRRTPWEIPPAEYSPVLQEFLDTFQERMKMRFMEQLGVKDSLPPNLERS